MQQAAHESEAFVEAKKMLMKKYGMTAEQASNAIRKGFEKMRAQLGDSAAGADVSNLEGMDEMSLYRLRNGAREALVAAQARKKAGGDGVERAPVRNKFV